MYQSIFKRFLTRERGLSEAQEPNGHTKQHWKSFQPASGTNKETVDHDLIFYGQWACVCPSVFWLDKTVLYDNTRLTSVWNIQPQQGSCTVYIAFYIPFQLHLYLITTRTKKLHFVANIYIFHLAVLIIFHTE